MKSLYPISIHVNLIFGSWKPWIISHGKLFHLYFNTTSSGIDDRRKIPEKYRIQFDLTSEKLAKSEKNAKNAKKWGFSKFGMFAKFSSIKSFCNLSKNLRNFCFYYFLENFSVFEISGFKNANFCSNVHLIEIKTLCFIERWWRVSYSIS